ncbi:MAG: hypothetical protein ACSHX6_13270, partial [Akkermansiaceae bacterium]
LALNQLPVSLVLPLAGEAGRNLQKNPIKSTSLLIYFHIIFYHLSTPPILKDLERSLFFTFPLNIQEHTFNLALIYKIQLKNAQSVTQKTNPRTLARGKFFISAQNEYPFLLPCRFLFNC